MRMVAVTSHHNDLDTTAVALGLAMQLSDHGSEVLMVEVGSAFRAEQLVGVELDRNPTGGRALQLLPGLWYKACSTGRTIRNVREKSSADVMVIAAGPLNDPLSMKLLKELQPMLTVAVPLTEEGITTLPQAARYLSMLRGPKTLLKVLGLTLVESADGSDAALSETAMEKLGPDVLGSPVTIISEGSYSEDKASYLEATKELAGSLRLPWEQPVASPEGDDIAARIESSKQRSAPPEPVPFTASTEPMETQQPGLNESSDDSVDEVIAGLRDSDDSSETEAMETVEMEVDDEELDSASVSQRLVAALSEEEVEGEQAFVYGYVFVSLFVVIFVGVAVVMAGSFLSGDGSLKALGGRASTSAETVK